MSRPLLLAVALVIPAVALAQQPTAAEKGTVRYRKSDNQEATANGDVTESAAGVVVKSGGKVVVTLSPADVVWVEWANMPDVNPVALRLTEARDPAKARGEYADMLKKGVQNPRAKRFAEFREAMTAARVADAKTGPDFATEAAAAVEKLATFARANAANWEVWPTYRTAARLQAELGKFADAAGTLQALAKVKDLPGELKAEAKLAELDVLFRAGNPLAVAPAASALAADKEFPKTGPAAEKLALYQAAVAAAQSSDAGPLKAVRDLLDKSADPGVKATGHFLLGELFLAKGRPRDAMWEYLWVETVYNQDRDDAAKAVGRLDDVFDKLGDKDRAAAYRDKLPRVKSGA